MWVTGFFNSLPKLLWSLYGPDCIDEVFARAGFGHHKHRKIKFRGITIMDAIGNDLKLPGFGTFAFEVAELAQKAGWYMMIIDATTQFAVDWTSAVYQYAGCQPSAGRWMKTKTTLQGMGPGPTIGAMLWGEDLEGDGSLLSPAGSGVTSYQGMNPGIAWSMKIGPYAPVPHPVGSVETWLEDEHGNQFGHNTTTPNPLTGIGYNNGFQRFPSPVPVSTSYRVRWRCTGGFADPTGSFIAISDASPAPFFPTPCANIKPVQWPPFDDD